MLGLESSTFLNLKILFNLVARKFHLLKYKTFSRDGFFLFFRAWA